MSRKIGIIGSGPVGRVLAEGFLRHGYDVMIGSREPSKLQEWQQNTGGKAQSGTFEDVAAFGELLVLAVKGSAAKNALEMAGANNLNGKTIIDTTNPIADMAPDNGVLHFFTDLDHSLMEQLQAAFPDAHFVKAFNSIGNAYMVNPDFQGQQPTMFICGNSTQAKHDVTQVLQQFGHDVADMGGVEAARAIEPLCMLWCIPGFLQNEWSHAFRLLRA
ncbi:NADPH-dependent F420 reductase [Pontibacter ruber]|uniref:NADPH-dependent F420 reductase n=1 Tax=Pontibacter ruber TaxID=1343895 RepID=A0ABW5CR07_9BACT|nr:NAD(P)-binding domain-containing protein [Pontibacter ruber]